MHIHHRQPSSDKRVYACRLTFKTAATVEIFRPKNNKSLSAISGWSSRLPEMLLQLICSRKCDLEEFSFYYSRKTLSDVHLNVSMKHFCVLFELKESMPLLAFIVIYRIYNYV